MGDIEGNLVNKYDGYPEGEEDIWQGCFYFHHDIQVDENGIIHSMGLEISRDVEGFETTQIGDTLVSVNPSSGKVGIDAVIKDTVPFEDQTPPVSTFTDFVFITRQTQCESLKSELVINGGPGTTYWSFGNALSQSRIDEGGWVASLRGLNALNVYDANFNRLFQFGGKSGTVVFDQDTDRFYGPHAPKQLANGNFLLYDNGLGRPAAEGGAYTRALELEVNCNEDYSDCTAKTVWNFSWPTTSFNPAGGNVDK